MARIEANILVVDGDEALGKGCQRILAEAGCRTTLSRSQADALKEVGRACFDIAFLDLETPGLSALRLLDEIKGKQPWLEVIVITQHPSIDEVKIAVRLGASEFLSKPVSPSSVVQIVAGAMERRRWCMHPLHPGDASPQPAGPGQDECTVVYEGGGLVSVGIEPNGAFWIGTPVCIELPLEGALVARGETLLKVLLQDGTIRGVASPVSGQVRRVNDMLLWDVQEIRRPGSWAVQMAIAPRGAAAPQGR